MRPSTRSSASGLEKSTAEPGRVRFIGVKLVTRRNSIGSNRDRAEQDQGGRQQPPMEGRPRSGPGNARLRRESLMRAAAPPGDAISLSAATDHSERDARPLQVGNRLRLRLPHCVRRVHLARRDGLDRLVDLVADLREHRNRTVVHIVRRADSARGPTGTSSATSCPFRVSTSSDRPDRSMIDRRLTVP